jgi:sulfur carrier protein ThiS
MKAKIKLFGTLSQGFPGYQCSEGMEVEMPVGATVKDLLTLLEIAESQGPVAIVEGRIQRADDNMRPGVPVNITQVIDGR